MVLALCLVLISLTACNQKTVQTHTATATSKTNNATAETSEAQAQVTTTSKASEKLNEFAKFVKESPKLGRNIELQMQELLAKELIYTSHLGLRKTFPNTLPIPLAYENDKLYYMSQRVPDGMSAEERDKALKNSQGGPEKHYFSYYDVKSKEKREVMVDDWHVMLADYATQVLPGNKLLVIYVSNGQDTKNNINTKIVVLDLDKQTQTTIAEYATFNALSAVKKLNDNEYAVLLTIITDAKQDKTQQILLHFDSTKNQIKEIYRGETMSEKRNDVFAFDCYDGKIYLLMHKLNNGKLNTFLRTIDKTGKELAEFELKALAKYQSPEQLAKDLFVEKDFIFVEFEGKGRVPEANNEPIVMLRRIGDNYELQNLSDMQIINIPQVHRQATEPLVMPKYMIDENTETYQYYAFSPENNTFDIWDTKVKREAGSHHALNIVNQKLFIFASDQESNCKYFIATPAR